MGTKTVFGMRRTGCLGIHVGRKFGYLVVLYLSDKQDKSFKHATIKTFKRILEKLKKNFFVNNDKEFRRYKELVYKIKTNVSFVICIRSEIYNFTLL